ncbi:MAG: LysR family transcriptional regulator [Clostridia bacterium]|nr:LysR family transcriptional regulator [Clostridia bacterium]
MNTLLFTYALEVEKTGSITQAAENLFMSQPALSKAVKELETTLGFPVFRRNAKGVVPTTKGYAFLGYARRIAAEMEHMQTALELMETSNQMFSLAISRASYVAETAADFIRSLDINREMEVDVLETSSVRVIDAVAEGHFMLGVIRCKLENEEFFLRRLAEKGLQHEVLWQSKYLLLLPERHPLAEKKEIPHAELEPYIEVLFGDEHVPYFNREALRGAEKEKTKRRVLIYDRAMQFDILRDNPMAYMWASATPPKLLQHHGLVMRSSPSAGEFKDLLISRAGYRYSALDRAFIDMLSLKRNEASFAVR